MDQTCRWCQKSFRIEPEDLEFYQTISPTFGGKKFEIPPPTLCYQCRLQRRLLFRNERNLYRRNCELTGKPTLTIFSEPYRMYSREAWWGDSWNELAYGRDFDFSKTVAEQLKSLSLAVPHSNMYQVNCENSEYSNQTLNCRNCYLLFGGGNSENVLYSKFVVNSHDVMDALSVNKLEWCYEASYCDSCYGCQYVSYSRNCGNSLFIEDCESCQDCLLCVGLDHAQYYVMNKSVGKEAYEKMKAELMPLTHEKTEMLRAKLAQLRASVPKRPHLFGSENCTGDLVVNSKNCFSCFDATNCEDSKYINFGPKNIRSYDCIFSAPDGLRFCYEMCSTSGMETSMAVYLGWNGGSTYYSQECQFCHDVFACVSMKKKQYCILNKQYTKEDYEKLVARIIEHMKETGEWGEYMNPLASSFGYNESIAQEYFPLTREQALEKGFKWRDQEVPLVAPASGDALTCQQCQKPYKLIDQERAFYEKFQLPIPNLCPNCRHKRRVAIRPTFTV